MTNNCQNCPRYFGVSPFLGIPVCSWYLEGIPHEISVRLTPCLNSEASEDKACNRHGRLADHGPYDG